MSNKGSYRRRQNNSYESEEEMTPVLRRHPRKLIFENRSPPLSSSEGEIAPREPEGHQDQGGGRNEKRSGEDANSSETDTPKSKRVKLTSSSSALSSQHTASPQTPQEGKVWLPGQRDLAVVLERIEDTISPRKHVSHVTHHVRFLKIVNAVLESAKGTKTPATPNYGGAPPSKPLIGLAQLSELNRDAAKMTALGVMSSLPVEKLVRLLILLGENIKGSHQALGKPEEEYDDEEDVPLTLESISRGMTASLTVLHILTSPQLSRRVYLEDVIDVVVHFTKFHLEKTLLPVFDPSFSKRGTGTLPSPRKKGAKLLEPREKVTRTFYPQLLEGVTLLASLAQEQILTDTTVLQLSSLGVVSFFGENIPQLQFSSLKLLTAIFTKYEAHRRLLLDDILGSIAKLPSSKRNGRLFKMSPSSDVKIQMLTALILQLVQGVTALGDSRDALTNEDPRGAKSSYDKIKEQDPLICKRFDTAVQTAGTFLTLFLSKCGSKSDSDYRPLFENFLTDLLATANAPEWPAAELLLSLLRNIFVNYAVNKTLDVSLRVASLEYLGLVVAHLRKDFVTAQGQLPKVAGVMDDLLAWERENNPGFLEEFKGFDPTKAEDKIELVQRVLLDYLGAHGETDPGLRHARDFCLSSWWWSARRDIEKRVLHGVDSGSPPKGRTTSGSEEEDEDRESDEDDRELEVNNKIRELVIRQKKFLFDKILPSSKGVTAVCKTEAGPSFFDRRQAVLFCRYAAARRFFFGNFDFYLVKILSASTDTVIAVRTKALRCLSLIAEADPTVLVRKDWRNWVQTSLMDHSPAVREATVDLIGKHVTSCPDLVDPYYEMLCTRIMDTGVSVRKRVIKILRDIILERPSFPKVPEICGKILKRIHDEDSIRNLVLQVFHRIWFTAGGKGARERDKLLQQVSLITDAVAFSLSRDGGVGLGCFEELIRSLLKPNVNQKEEGETPKSSEPSAAMVTACQQRVDCLVEYLLQTEETSSKSTGSSRFVAAISTLLLFAKVRPALLVPHAGTLESYLSLRSTSCPEQTVVIHIASILELVVPLMDHPAPSFLSQLEEDCVRLIFQKDGKVIVACMAGLAAVVNNVTKNHCLVRDCFRKFYDKLLHQAEVFRGQKDRDPSVALGVPQIRRSLFTIGLFFRYFDFSSPTVHGDLPDSLVHDIFRHLLFFLKQPASDLQYLALQALGNVCVRYYEFMLGPELMGVYHRSLMATGVPVGLKVQTLANIQLYLTEEEQRMVRQDASWRKGDGGMDIKGMGDVTSGMASTVIQLYLKQILGCYLHKDPQVRRGVGRVVQLVLKQGLVNPIQMVPYLVCMGTDEEVSVSATAEKDLKDIHKKYPQFLQSCALSGIRLSLLLCRILAGYNRPSGSEGSAPSELEGCKVPVVRGYRRGYSKKEEATALNGHLYSILRSTKTQRRALVLLLIKQFEDQPKTPLTDLLYLADNLAHFPYQVVDEPLFVIHRVDLMVSVCGSNNLQNFEEALLSTALDRNQSRQGDEDEDMESDTEIEDDETVESLVSRFPADTKILEDCLVSCQSCVLLLALRQHLKTSYGLSDSRIGDYSPTDSTKQFERPLKKKTGDGAFQPKSVLKKLKRPPDGSSREGREAMAAQYLQFKELMMSIDSEGEGEEEEDDDNEDRKQRKILIKR